jgi:hypothetical protein
MNDVAWLKQRNGIDEIVTISNLKLWPVKQFEDDIAVPQVAKSGKTGKEIEEDHAFRLGDDVLWKYNADKPTGKCRIDSVRFTGKINLVDGLPQRIHLAGHERAERQGGGAEHGEIRAVEIHQAAEGSVARVGVVAAELGDEGLELGEGGGAEGGGEGQQNRQDKRGEKRAVLGTAAK